MLFMRNSRLIHLIGLLTDLRRKTYLNIGKYFVKYIMPKV